MQKEEKQAHAIQIREAMHNVITVLESNPDLWFGGYPYVYDQIRGALRFQEGELNRIFELEPATA